jgi:hypothetical protein
MNSLTPLPRLGLTKSQVNYGVSAMSQQITDATYEQDFYA